MDALIEQRLAAVEAAVTELQRQVTPPHDPDWLAVLTGSQRGEPAFADVLSLGRAFRAASLPDGETP